MALDPSIPLSVKAPQVELPLQMFSNILQVRGQQQQMQENALKLQAQQRAARDDQALRSAMQYHSKPGQKLDMFAVADTLDAGGYGPVALTLREKAIGQQKEWALAQQEQMKALDLDLTMATNIAIGMWDGEIPFHKGKAAIASLRSEWGQELGDELDPDKLKSLIDIGKKTGGSIKLQQEALAAGQKALELTMTAQRDRQTYEAKVPDIVNEFKKAYGGLISAAESPEDLEKIRSMAMSSTDLSRQVGQLIPDSLDAAKKLAETWGTTPKERADIAETARTNKAREKLSAEQNQIGWANVKARREELKLTAERWKGDPANEENNKKLAEMVVNNPDLLPQLNPVLKGQVLKAMVSNDMTFKSARQRLTETMMGRAQTVIADLETMKGKAGAIGAPSLLDPGSLTRIVGLDPAAGSAAADYTEAVESLRALLTAPDMELMRGFGHLSDADMKILQRAATQLGGRLTEDRFNKVLGDVKTAVGNSIALYQKKEGAVFPTNVGSIPVSVQEDLKNDPPGLVTYEDGSVYRKNANGTIVKVK